MVVQPEVYNNYFLVHELEFPSLWTGSAYQLFPDQLSNISAFPIMPAIIFIIRILVKIAAPIR